MRCSINSRLLIVLTAVVSLSARADFNEATRAYLLGDYEKARYEALIDATDGKPEAQMLLGQLYFNGEGVEKDLQAAMYWYEKAAIQGFVDAQYRLGSLYFDGKHDIPKDYDKAYRWLQLAQDNGHADAKPKLDGLYKTEAGRVVNLHESPEVLQQVAGTGNKQARFLYSEKLLKGEGYPQDKATAVTMLTEDAHEGFVKAQKRLGELYYHGDGVPQDYYEAYAWSMAYAGTKELGGLMREGKQTARSALRKLDDANHQLAYEKSREYFEKYVLPFHENAREVGPDKYRIVVRSRKAQLAQTQQSTQAKPPVAAASNQIQTTTQVTSPVEKLCESIEDKAAERSKEDVAMVFDKHKGVIYSTYNRALRKKPSISGRVEYEIEIAATGSVTAIRKRASSTLTEPEFEAQLVERIKQIDFCAKGSKPFMVVYPIEFIPPDDGKKNQTDPVLARTMAAVERNQGPAGGETQVIDRLRDNVTQNKVQTAPPRSSDATISTTTGEVAANPMASEVMDIKAPAKSPDMSVGTAGGTVPTQSSAASLPAATTATVVAEPASDGDSAHTASSIDQSAATASGAAPKENEPGTAVAMAATTNAAGETRSYREVHNVFTRHKSRLNDLYLRAYEQDKKIHGRIVFELTIDPGGAAVSVGIQSSELESPALEEELIDYIKGVDFGKKNAAPYEVTYPLDFLP
ncbi:MAG: hypothetical protein AMJ55_01600 [Gammaproteobacteria bacterium SG8_15]|nr:MAG: hypothetical protein AMJ55_01600 [Gammaproteobacteria bacterium SG8_15]